jgi:hypothetical protein
MKVRFRGGSQSLLSIGLTVLFLLLFRDIYVNFAYFIQNNFLHRIFFLLALNVVVGPALLLKQSRLLRRNLGAASETGAIVEKAIGLTLNLARRTVEFVN